MIDLTPHERLALIEIIDMVQTTFDMTEYKHPDFKDWVKVAELKDKLKS